MISQNILTKFADYTTSFFNTYVLNTSTKSLACSLIILLSPRATGNVATNILLLSLQTYAHTSIQTICMRVHIVLYIYD